jgi:hypothetical protein
MTSLGAMGLIVIIEIVVAEIRVMNNTPAIK